MVKIRFWLPVRFVVAGFRGDLEKMLSPTGDRWFESISVQRGVCAKPDFPVHPDRARPDSKTGVNLLGNRKFEIHLPPAGSLQNAAKRLDTGKLSSGSEPGAYTVLVGCGLRRCSAASASRRKSSYMFWPMKGVLNQSRNCAVESAWSSCLPFGNTASSWRYSVSHRCGLGAFCLCHSLYICGGDSTLSGSRLNDVWLLVFNRCEQCTPLSRAS